MFFEDFGPPPKKKKKFPDVHLSFFISCGSITKRIIHSVAISSIVVMYNDFNIIKIENQKMGFSKLESGEKLSQLSDCESSGIEKQPPVLDELKINFEIHQIDE